MNQQYEFHVNLFVSVCRLKPLDIEFMKRLHEKVNVIPMIAKADTLTPEECQQFKKQVSDFLSDAYYCREEAVFSSVVISMFAFLCTLT